MKIVLCGYRASGKSTLGTFVADRLGWPCLDIDRGIEARCGMTLTDFYRIDPVAFRDMETEVVLEICRRDDTVISFGAGSLMKAENRRVACRDALVVYLQASVEELWRRIDSDPKSAATRPPLAGGGIAEVREMLAQREPVYLECAELVLDATRPPEQLAGEVIAALRERSRA